MRKKIFLGIVVLALLGGIGYLIAEENSDQPSLQADFSAESNTISEQDSKSWVQASELDQWVKDEAGESSQSAQKNPARTISVPKELFTETYQSPDFGYSFLYPPAFTIGRFDQGVDSKIVLLQHPQRQIGVQVTVTPLDEKIDLTAALIKKELPDYQVINPQPVTIAGEKKGVVFKSKNDRFGTSREIWFTYKQNLYQITSYASLDPFIKTFFETWKFQ